MADQVLFRDHTSTLFNLLPMVDNLVKDMKENTKDLQDLKRKKAELFASL